MNIGIVCSKIFRNQMFWLILFSGFISNTCSQELISGSTSFPEAFSKLTGVWKQKNKDVYEIWSAEDGIIFVNVYEISNEDTIHKEWINILATESDIYYSVIVDGQNNNKAVKFKLIDADPYKLVFENRNHDFPQKIEYLLTDPENLYVTISGMIQNETKKIQFYFVKQKENH